jgi:hypothetical protein
LAKFPSVLLTFERLEMRIVGQAPVGSKVQTQAVSSNRRGQSLRVETGESLAHQPPGIAPNAGLASLQGLMVLQEENEPAHAKRQKAARRGFMLLDALGALKAGLLAGNVNGSALKTLQFGLAEARGGDQEPALRAVFDAIETRAAVELAKLGR